MVPSEGLDPLPLWEKVPFQSFPVAHADFPRVVALSTGRLVYASITPMRDSARDAFSPSRSATG